MLACHDQSRLAAHAQKQHQEGKAGTLRAHRRRVTRGCRCSACRWRVLDDQSTLPIDTRITSSTRNGRRDRHTARQITTQLTNKTSTGNIIDDVQGTGPPLTSPLAPPPYT